MSVWGLLLSGRASTKKITGYMVFSILVVMLYCSFANAIFRGNWVKSRRDLSILFLTALCESLMI